MTVHPDLRFLAPPALLALALAAAPAAGTPPTPGGTCVDNLQLFADQNTMSVTVTWDPVAGATTYHVFRSLDEGNATLVGVLPANQTTFHEEGLPGGLVTYQVAADGGAHHCEGQTVHLHGDEGGGPEPVCATGLAAEARAGGEIVLTWEATADATSYDVLRAEGDQPLVPHAFAGTATTFTDTDTTAGVTYLYVVNANGLVQDPAACPGAAVTAIPFLAGPLLAVALLGAVGAFLLARR